SHLSAPSELAQTLHYGEGFRGGQVNVGLGKFYSPPKILSKLLIGVRSGNGAQPRHCRFAGLFAQTGNLASRRFAAGNSSQAHWAPSGYAGSPLTGASADAALL
ncbi:hypothetical protein Q4577_23625, partial [Marinovum sp. 2_MG-2023]|uniref:hypothetical protein n=1 Tax=unclassified Marinovum TaxID=2647166 RepID=UPI0026E32643